MGVLRHWHKAKKNDPFRKERVVSINSALNACERIHSSSSVFLFSCSKAQLLLRNRKPFCIRNQRTSREFERTCREGGYEFGR